MWKGNRYQKVNWQGCSAKFTPSVRKYKNWQNCKKNAIFCKNNCIAEMQRTMEGLLSSTNVLITKVEHLELLSSMDERVLGCMAEMEKKHAYLSPK
jgi:hypothetical protein